MHHGLGDHGLRDHGLMHHGLTHDRTTPLAGRRLWLFAGTGEGPPLAEALLSLGWQLRVSVVTAQGGRIHAG